MFLCVLPYKVKVDLLDGRDVELDAASLVIADESGALAWLVSLEVSTLQLVIPLNMFYWSLPTLIRSLYVERLRTMCKLTQVIASNVVSIFSYRKKLLNEPLPCWLTLSVVGLV